MEFEIIRGGAETLRYKYIGGGITDTRLMGVMGMHLHWRAEDAQTDEYDKHQFFYYDVEELGLDQLAVYVGNEPLAVELACKTVFGGLGGKLVDICEREARFLVQKFVADTRQKGEPLPAAIEELRFILDAPAPFTPGEEFVLGRKMCVPRATDYAACHYFIMRLMGHDPEGAALLAAPSLSPDKYREISLPDPATFLMSRATRTRSGIDGSVYLCESLVETDVSHYMEFTELRVHEGCVESAKLKTRFAISDIEAGMKLRHEEYVSVYEITGERGIFDINFGAYSIGTTVSTHDCGTMYMEFKPDNSHVERPLFVLNDDVQAVYFISDADQMIVSAYSYEAIVSTEAAISASILRDCVRQTNKYRFRDSVIYDFAQSGYTDFEEFIKNIEV